MHHGMVSRTLLLYMICLNAASTSRMLYVPTVVTSEPIPFCNGLGPDEHIFSSQHILLFVSTRNNVDNPPVFSHNRDKCKGFPWGRCRIEAFLVQINTFLKLKIGSGVAELVGNVVPNVCNELFNSLCLVE